MREFLSLKLIFSSVLSLQCPPSMQVATDIGKHRNFSRSSSKELGLGLSACTDLGLEGLT